MKVKVRSLARFRSLLGREIEVELAEGDEGVLFLAAIGADLDQIVV